MTHLFSRQKRLEKFTQIFTSDEDALLWAATKRNSLAAFEAFKKEFYQTIADLLKELIIPNVLSKRINVFNFSAGAKFFLSKRP
jgi:hypothetical protein